MSHICVDIFRYLFRSYTNNNNNNNNIFIEFKFKYIDQYIS